MLPFDLDVNIGVNAYLIAAAVLVFLVIVAAVKTVPQGMHYTVERFGRYTRTLRPGLRALVPLVERIGRRQDVREQSLAVNIPEVLPAARVPLRASLRCFYQVIDTARAAYEVANVREALPELLASSLGTLIADLDLDVALGERSGLNQRLLEVTDDSSAAWGVRVTRLEVESLRPPEGLLEAVAEEMRAERRRRSAVAEADGERRAAVLRAEGRKESTLMEAEARRDAGELEGEARDREAEADARALLMISEALAEGSVHALNYLAARDYVDAVRSLARSDRVQVVVLPLESAGLPGNLAGVTRLAEAALHAGSSRTDGGDEPPAATAAEDLDELSWPDDVAYGNDAHTHHGASPDEPEPA